MCRAVGIGGRGRGSIVPSPVNNIQSDGLGQIVPTTLLITPQIFKHSYGPDVQTTTWIPNNFEIDLIVRNHSLSKQSAYIISRRVN